MFTHAEVWHGIDGLAKQHGLTASGLARRAGLDPTTFNPSKRITKQSKPRWPSTESLAKILTATETSFADFVAIMSDRPAHADPGTNPLRCVAFDQAAREGLFDDSGFPVGEDWDEMEFPSVEDPHAYALEVRGDAMGPTYRDGDLLIVSPAAQIRRRDRVLLKPMAPGAPLAGILLRRTAQKVELAPFDAPHATQVYAIKEVAWLGRIVWVSQ